MLTRVGQMMDSEMSMGNLWASVMEASETQATQAQCQRRAAWLAPRDHRVTGVQPSVDCPSTGFLMRFTDPKVNVTGALLCDVSLEW